jgi:hypothetical protein
MPLLAMLILPGAQPAWAHGGEDHGEAAPAPVAQAGIAPRAAAETEDFELVAVLTGGMSDGRDSSEATKQPVLTLYLDRFTTNQPVQGATVEVESGAFKAVAQAKLPGVYTLPGRAFTKPGRYPLTVSVQTADGADLLDATLVNDAPGADGALAAAGKAKGPATASLLARPWAWAAGLGLLLLALGGVAWARRRARASTYRA